MFFWKELMVILEREWKVLESLKELTYQKTDIIVNNEITTLEKMLKEEEEIINLLADIEEKRIDFLDNWGVKKEIPLTEVIERSDEGKDELMEIGMKLSSTLEEIHSRNNTNRQLIQENLEWLDFNMNLLTNPPTPATYNKGEKGKESKKSVFDRKV